MALCQSLGQLKVSQEVGGCGTSQVLRFIYIFFKGSKVLMSGFTVMVIQHTIEDSKFWGHTELNLEKT
jgi:hypothetical protein